MANSTARAFEAAALDRALARQWITAVVGAARSGMGFQARISIGRKGVQTIGLSDGEFGKQMAIGIVRMAERKLR